MGIAKRAAADPRYRKLLAPPPRQAPADFARLALGTIDEAGRKWFLHRDGSLGNPLRTPDPASARTWATIEDVTWWLDNLPAGTQALLADRRLVVWPLTVTVGSPTHALELRTVREADPAAGVGAGRAAERSLLDEGEEATRGDG